MSLKAPFPWFGGKRSHAGEVWAKFGKPDVYAEPFAGSLAVLLACPRPAKHEVVCDTNGMVCNLWRSLIADPERTAWWADYPTIHQDLHARHIWLHKWIAEESHKLIEDPHYYNCKVAGWWVWGISLWIGSSWCQKGSPDRDTQPKSSPGGMGVSAQACRDTMPTVSVGGGKGISAQSQGGQRISSWFGALQQRLKQVIVLNRSWESGVTPSVLGDTDSMQERTLNRCVFLDPPYRQHGKGMKLYDSDVDGTTDDVAVAAHAWALEHGHKYRIAYCCQVGDFDFPPDWHGSVREFTGYRLQDKKGQAGKLKDLVMYSPACVEEKQQGLF